MRSYVRSMENEDKQLSRFSEEQVQELYPKLRKYCQFLTQSIWDGEDLVQDSLLKAWYHYRSLEEVNSALVNKMAYNQWIDTVRKRKRETLVSDGNEESTTNDIELVDFRCDAVEKLLNDLTPKQAVVLTLKEAFLFQNAEIAELLQTTETSIKSILHRAKKRIKNKDTIQNKPYTNNSEVEHLELILNESLLTQDPTILIQSIPFIRSLQKELKTPTCSIPKNHRSLSRLSSSTVYMAA